MVAAWPACTGERDDQALRAFTLVQDMISNIRNVRSEYRVPPGRYIAAVVSLPAGSQALQDTLTGCAEYFARLARVDTLTVAIEAERPAACASVVIKDVEVFLPLAGMVDLERERARVQAEIEQKEAFLARVQRKLQNRQFVERAPRSVVERERAKERDATAEIARLRAGMARWSAS